MEEPPKKKKKKKKDKDEAETEEPEQVEMEVAVTEVGFFEGNSLKQLNSETFLRG